MVAWGENPKRNGRKEFSDKSSISLNRRILEREAADQSEQICRNYPTFGGRICLMISLFGFQPSLWFLGFQPSLSSYNCITTKRKNIFRLPLPPPIFSNSFLYTFPMSTAWDIKTPGSRTWGKSKAGEALFGDDRSFVHLSPSKLLYQNLSPLNCSSVSHFQSWKDYLRHENEFLFNLT